MIILYFTNLSSEGKAKIRKILSTINDPNIKEVINASSRILPKIVDIVQNRVSLGYDQTEIDLCLKVANLLIDNEFTFVGSGDKSLFFNYGIEWVGPLLPTKEKM